MTTPPFDLNVPVTNPRLVEAIRKHQQFRNGESAAVLFGEFKAAVLLAAVILESPAAQISDTQALLKKGDEIAVVEIWDNDDNRLLALFTDHDELRQFAPEANSTLAMPAKDALHFTLNKDYAGLVINPASNETLRLDAPFIRTLIGDM